MIMEDKKESVGRKKNECANFSHQINISKKLRIELNANEW